MDVLVSFNLLDKLEFRDKKMMIRVNALDYVFVKIGREVRSSDFYEESNRLIREYLNIFDKSDVDSFKIETRIFLDKFDYFFKDYFDKKSKGV